MAKFINPFTDIGFKRIFGQEVSKPILVKFLNCLLDGERTITDLKLLDKEQPGESADDKSLIYDVYCEVDGGEHIIVEMQYKSQSFFKNRCVYYLARSISTQGEPGPKWSYSDVKAVYIVALMNFKMSSLGNEFRTDVGLMDLRRKEPFSDKMRLVFLQMPCFTKSVEECETLFDKLIYVLKNMEVLKRMPWLAQDAVFQKLESVADVASLSKREREIYDENLRKFRDTVAVMEGQWMEGHASGLAEGMEKGVGKANRENARRMKADGMPAELIAKYTGLTIEAVNSL